ncbi:GNAT family N-acetyltransferase [Oceanirhabdus seepicola]|uniref:GNAT family N-acetyltransferase n=1 Tax=Oceanirhabdus seepicola TaxID=2828781 RepID=A0A9J6P2J1_9CLOT|nr:GNAT family N-acetyltransferase [Oceanirhabdus seepicola]MCM1990604.1 GNAT family N-acetyltransferase [Oceanirhabdus seepicola]
MYKVDSNFEKFKKVFSSNINKFVFESIIEGNTPGEIYLNNLENPELYVIFDKGNFVLYVGGETATHKEYDKCINYIKENILTESLKKDFYNYVKISYTSDIWKNVMLDIFNNLTVHQRKRVLYKYNLHNNDNKFLENHSSEIKPINQELLNDSNLENLKILKEEIKGMWGTVDGFIKNGFGYCAFNGKRLISCCTAELVSKNHCGIGIETIEDDQKKGVGTALAANIVKDCAQRNLIPHWDSWIDNLASVKIAEKVGFNKIEEYEVLVVEF